MKVQIISNSLTKSKNRFIQNHKTGSINSQEMRGSVDNISFAGSKIDLVKKFIKPETLDLKLSQQMAKLNLSESSSRITSKIKTGDYTNLLLKKIEIVNQRIDSLETSLATYTKPKSIIEAEEKINFYNNWNDEAEYSDHLRRAEAAKQKERDKYWWGFKWCSDGDEKFDEVMKPYYTNHYRYRIIEDDLDNLKTLIRNNNSTQAQKKETLDSLKREKDSYYAELTSARLGDVVNEVVNKKGSVNDRIAGYEDVKKILRQKFIGPLLSSQKDTSVSLPNAVVLYGATGVGKTEMLRGIEEECRNVANIVTFPMATPEENFMKVLNDILVDARKNYLNNKKRTIILIDEAEKYMCMRKNQATRYAADLEPDDFDILALSGEKDVKNIQYLKSLLDRISEVPDMQNNTKSASTLFITTNYPHLIDQDLMKRKGKFMPIAVRPAADANLLAVIQHYFKQNSTLLETIKSYARFPNFENILDSQVKFTEKAKQVILEKQRNGTLSNLNIDYELTDWPDVNKFLKFTNPSKKKGAYSNVELKHMINTAFDNYLENPTQPMYKYFFDAKNETLRDITPKRYEKFRAIYSMVNDKVENEGLDEASKEFTDLINSYQNGMLNEEMSKAVETRMENVLKELVKLEDLKKSGLQFSAGEQMRYDLFKKWSDMWE